MLKMLNDRKVIGQLTSGFSLLLFVTVLEGCSTPPAADIGGDLKDEPPGVTCRMNKDSVASEAETKACKSECKKGDVWSCKKLGATKEKAGDIEEARRYYRISCEPENRTAKGDLIACQELGRLNYLGQGGKEDIQEARRLFKRVCDGGHGGGCFILALLYYADDGKAEQAKEYATRA
ncbi:MAG: sel1 repeat family protein, partial [bacterium]|nr:sel1 repeat family protein [bacterium]